MITCSIICVLLGIYSASTNKVDVTLNLSSPNKIHFRKECRPSCNYHHLIFFPNDNYQIETLLDSAIDIWKKREEVILESVDVYYKHYVPQLLTLNLIESDTRNSEFYVRNNGTFMKIRERTFVALRNNENIFDPSLYLDLERGFCYNYFDAKESEIKGKQFVEYYPKKNLEIFKLTCGEDDLVNESLGQSLEKIVRHKVSQGEELLKVVVRSVIRGKFTKCYHLKDDEIKPVSLSKFKKMCDSLPEFIDQNIPNVSYFSDSPENPQDDYIQGPETEYKGPELQKDDSSQQGPTISGSPTMSEAIHKEIERRYNVDGSRRASDPQSPKKSLVEVIREQIEKSSPTSKEKRGERPVNIELQKISPSSVPHKASESSEKLETSDNPVKKDISKSFVKSRVLDIERSQGSERSLAPEVPHQPLESNEPLVTEPLKEPIFTEPIGKFILKEETFVPVYNEFTSEPVETERLRDPAFSKVWSEDLDSDRLCEVLFSPEHNTPENAPKKDSGSPLKQSEEQIPEKSVEMPEGSEMETDDSEDRIPEIYLERTIINEPEELPSVDSLVEILGKEYIEEKLKAGENRYELDDDYLAKILSDSEETETAEETESDNSTSGTFEDDYKTESRDCACGAKNCMDMYPHVLEEIEDQANPSYEEKNEEGYQERTKETQWVDSVEISLYLDAEDDPELFDIYSQERKNGFSVNLYKPKFKLVAVKNTLPLWVADMNEVECIDVKLYKYFDEPWALRLNIETAEGSKMFRFFNPARYSEITEHEYESLVYDLLRKSEDQEPKGLSLNLEYGEQPHLHARLISDEFKTPYMVYSAHPGYSFTSVYLSKKLVWKANRSYPFADTATYYTHLGSPAYLVLNIPESSKFIKEITIDLVTLKKVAELSQMQLKSLLDVDPADRLVFNLADPISTEQFQVSKVHYKGFMIRNFAAGSRKVTSIYDREEPVTPTNIVPFQDFKVYYFKNLPVMVLTDPYVGPGYFRRTSLGWTTSGLIEINGDLESIKLDLEDTSLHPRTFISLDYYLARDKNFLVEIGRRRRVPYKSFVPVMGNIISSIYCSCGFVLQERERRTSSGVTFLLKDRKPYKAEILVNARAGLKKMVFKVLDRESRQWTQVDESVFLEY